MVHLLHFGATPDAPVDVLAQPLVHNSRARFLAPGQLRARNLFGFRYDAHQVHVIKADVFAKPFYLRPPVHVPREFLLFEFFRRGCADQHEVHGPIENEAA